jgi:phosphate transport system substrate-binding protein
VLAAFALAAPAHARDQIRIVGSSTVFPFSTAVAESFGRAGGFKTPVVESTGTGGGIQLFCSGNGMDTPDIANASRRIKAGELETCTKNGVKEVVEVKIGYDGIVLANSKKHGRYNLTKEQVFRALAKQVPIDGKLTANPYKLWSDIDASLPKEKIEVLGPPPTSGTRDAFVELAMEGGAEAFPMLKELRRPPTRSARTGPTSRRARTTTSSSRSSTPTPRRSACSASPSSTRTPTRSRAASSAASTRRSRTSRAASTASRARCSST